MSLHHVTIETDGFGCFGDPSISHGMRSFSRPHSQCTAPRPNSCAPVQLPKLWGRSWTTRATWRSTTLGNRNSHASRFTYMYYCIYVYMYVHVYVYVTVCIFVNMELWIYGYTDIWIYVYGEIGASLTHNLLHHFLRKESSSRESFDPTWLMVGFFPT